MQRAKKQRGVERSDLVPSLGVRSPPHGMVTSPHAFGKG